jgi:hypothetical protein
VVYGFSASHSAKVKKSVKLGTVDVVRQFECGGALLNVDVEHVVILAPFVDLSPARSDSIHDIAYFLPLVRIGVPLRIIVSFCSIPPLIWPA